MERFKGVEEVSVKHKDKVKLARKMRTHVELKAKVPIFQTEAWEKRKKAIKKRSETKTKKKD